MSFAHALWRSSRGTCAADSAEMALSSARFCGCLALAQRPGLGGVRLGRLRGERIDAEDRSEHIIPYRHLFFGSIGRTWRTQVGCGLEFLKLFRGELRRVGTIADFALSHAAFDPGEGFQRIAVLRRLRRRLSFRRGGGLSRGAMNQRTTRRRSRVPACRRTGC